MIDEGYIPDNNPIKKIAPFLIIVTAIICIFLTIYCLLTGINNIYPHLYYIPIILTAILYPKKGTAFAILLGVLFLFTTFVITEGDPVLITENFIRILVFVAIAYIVSKASFHLREENLKYRNLIDSSGAASAVLNDKGKIVHANSAFENITGRTLKELKRMNWVSVFEDECRRTALMLYMSSIKGERDDKSYEDLIVKSRQGKEYNVLATIRHVRELGITLISLVDVTEKKNSEKMIGAQKERYKKLFQESTEGIFIHNSDGRIFNANPEALRITGMSLQELKNTNLKSIIPQEFHNAYKYAARTDLEEGKTFKMEPWIKSKTGERIDLDLISVMVDKKTKVIQSITRDITIRKKNEKALGIAMKKLNLLSSITRHDILNHIMVAKANLVFAMEDTKDESIKNFLEKSLLAMDTIQHQIEFSRDYQDMGGNPPRWHKLDKVIDSCIKSQNLPPEIFIQKKIQNIEIFADPMFEKVICNLIGNSIMHGGEISRISISTEEEYDSYNLIFEDDGKGIPEKEKHIIFKAGYGRNHGFGLYLVSEILSITGASIRETGIENKGARFEIMFPKEDLRFERHESHG